MIPTIFNRINPAQPVRRNITGDINITGDLDVGGTITSGGVEVPTGTGAATRLAYWSDTNSLTSTADMTYDGATVAFGTAAVAQTKTANADTVNVITNLTNGTSASAQTAFVCASGAASYGVFPSNYTAGGGGFLANKSAWYSQTMAGGMLFGDAPVSGGGIFFTTNGTPAAGLLRLHIKSTTEAVFNEPGSNYDFRVEGDTDTVCIFVDASVDCVGHGVAAPTSKTHTTSMAAATASVAVDTTLTVAHFTVRVDANAAARTITLPAAAGCSGRIYNVKKIDASANTVTIDGNGAETIDGAATLVLLLQYDHTTIQSNGTSWDVIG